MSWLSEITNDIGNVFGINDLASDLPEIGIGAAALAAPFALPALGADLGLTGAAAGADAATAASAPLDLGAAALAPATTATTDLGTSALGFAGDVGANSVVSGDFDALNAINSAVGAGGAATGDVSNALDLSTLAADAPLNTAVGAPLNIVPAASTAGGGGGILSSISSTLAPVTGALKTAAPILGAAGLGYNLYTGYEEKQALQNLTNTENAEAATAAQTAATANAAATPELNWGQTLQQYLTTNTLPPQYMSAITQQVQATKAGIIQGYASRGMSTDPNQNSALQQDLANVDAQAITLQTNLEESLSTAGNQMVQTANSLLAQGLSATEISAQLPIAMQQLNIQLANQTSTAISSFAAAMNGNQIKPGQVTLTLPSS